MNLWLIFITGLTVGGLTCIAVQGGLLASVIAAQQTKSHWPVGAFLVGKLISHLILGFLLGFLGQSLALSDNVRIVMQILAGIYMIAVALDMLNVHPIFKYAILQPPRFLTRLVRNESKSRDLFAPFFLGLMTILIPCGTTLAMEALAISSGNAFLGGLIMGVFVLGTFPLFFGLGVLTTVLGNLFKTKFLKIAAIIVIYLGITSINGALVLAGSPVTLQTLAENSPIQIDLSRGGNSNSNTKLESGVQTADIYVYPAGYSPNYIQVKAGSPVRLNLYPTGGLGCTNEFRIPTLGISKSLRNGPNVVEFTPAKAGKLTWTCSMGMYSGVIDVQSS